MNGLAAAPRKYYNKSRKIAHKETSRGTNWPETFKSKPSTIKLLTETMHKKYGMITHPVGLDGTDDIKGTTDEDKLTKPAAPDEPIEPPDDGEGEDESINTEVMPACGNKGGP